MIVGFRLPRIAIAALLAATLAPLPSAGAQGPGGLPSVRPDAPIRLVASKVPMQDATSHIWSPDAPYADGGRLVRSIAQVSGTANPFLYQLARRGVTGYRIPVQTPGMYFVNVYTAELRGAHPGRRVWDLTAEGRPAATAIDVAHTAGPIRAWHVMFSVPVTDGVLNLHVVRRVGTPIIGALQVDYQSAAVVHRTLFNDDFNGPAGRGPSALHWQADKGGRGWGNNELQSYTARPRNLALDGHGHLFITARRETFTGADHITRDYTSARIKTQKRFSFQYGRAVARILVPKGRGLWPAFWALGDNINSAGWPLCGEIDVMENLGSQPRIVHAVVHGGQSSGGTWLAGAPLKPARPVAGNYHDYGMVWGPSGISMSIDNRTYMTVASGDLGPQDLWNFTHSFHLLLNLAVGGTWPGSPTHRTPFPAIMSVDYVRVTG
jgi:beta-glucanase (GH16 family)